MKMRLIRMLVLFWLAWYVTGPVCETFDYWDSPRQEVHDILFYGGGGVTLVAAGFCLALAVFRAFRERCLAASARSFRSSLLPLAALSFVSRGKPAATFIHSPPVTLRI